MKSKLLILLSLWICISFSLSAQGLKGFQLKNGLTVFIWEDNSKNDVYGIVGVRAGSVNDPAEYTGLAHYLEHVMFKGTEKIGALNWEEEKPLYNQIIAKYEEMALEENPERTKAISAEINELTIKAGEISLSNEFFDLMEGMGATGVNAGTIYDYTLYHNVFPSFQINKWLEISSERFINPVFRAFQPELETVYEEYNMGKDNPNRVLNEFIFSKAFEGHPYGRSVIGLGEHLKKPRLQKLIDFYNDWYKPENMVLILVGNVNTQQITPQILSTFGRLEKGTIPERTEYPQTIIKGRKQHNIKVSHQPSVSLIYNGIPTGHPDEAALIICLRLLSNQNNTGVLDKLTIDGDLMGAYASAVYFREQGKNIIMGFPLYDENQKRYESNRSVEKKLTQSIEKIVKGDFEEWVIDGIKLELCREFDLHMESNEDIGILLLDAFINEKDLNDVLGYKDLVAQVSIEDIKRVAKEYLSGNNFIAVYNDKGKPDKNAKITKPEYKPLVPPVGQSSDYAQYFKALPISYLEEKEMTFSDVRIQQVNDRSQLFYTLNEENDVFTLMLRYGVGAKEFPKLGYAASLMNNAGILGIYEAHELKQELSRLGASCTVRADDSYLTIVVKGYEHNLEDICLLLTRQILMPKLDDKQLSNLKGSELGARMSRKDNINALSRALREYLFYQNQSEYIQELTDKEILGLQISELTGDINRASQYETQIHYSGNLPFEQVYDILSTALPLVEGEKASDSPVVKELADYQETTIFFLPYSDTEQSNIYFYFPVGEYNSENDVIVSAFNQYFDGGFNGLVLNEIREKNSMAYSAYGRIIHPPIPGKKSYFTGYIGTQNDKAADAIELYLKLLRDMPQRPERIENIKEYIRQLYLTSTPEVRDKSLVYESWKRRGYNDYPAKVNLPKAKALTFDDIVAYYKENIHGKPIAIAIIGNPKDIDMDALKKFGKVIRLDNKKLFNDKDKLF